MRRHLPRAVILANENTNATGNFHIVNQIIERGLHSADDEIKIYTTNLVDKLEQVCPSHNSAPLALDTTTDHVHWQQFKSENPQNETITDNDAASAYVEQFGLEVFNRAEAAMTANKVTK